MTGGRGFIGRPLVRHFVESQGETVLSVDVLPAGRADEDARRIDIELDVRDRDRLREVFAHFNIFAVYDLASITKVKLAKSEYLPNTETTQPRMTLPLVNSAATRKFTLPSSRPGCRALPCHRNLRTTVAEPPCLDGRLQRCGSVPVLCPSTTRPRQYLF